MFRAPLCPSSGAREYYTSCCCLSYLVLGFQVVGMVWSWGLCVRFAGCCAQHVSGTIMPIIRSSRVLYNLLLPVVFVARFSSWRYGVELRVVCPVCGLLRCSYILKKVCYATTTMKCSGLRNTASRVWEISGFRCEIDENCALLGYYAVCSGNSLPTFRGNMSVRN